MQVHLFFVVIFNQNSKRMITDKKRAVCEDRLSDKPLDYMRYFEHHRQKKKRLLKQHIFQVLSKGQDAHDYFVIIIYFFFFFLIKTSVSQHLT